MVVRFVWAIAGYCVVCSRTGECLVPVPSICVHMHACCYGTGSYAYVIYLEGSLIDAIGRAYDIDEQQYLASYNLGCRMVHWCMQGLGRRARTCAP